jgi:hypothetical protein
MHRTVFAEQLRRAAARTLEFTRSLILEPLPDALRFEARLNQSQDGPPLHPDERLYPEDTERIPDHHRSRLTSEQVVELLWREGAVPEWIDLSVKWVEDAHTLIELRCCGRFTSNERLLYYEDGEGQRMPFQVHGPPLPPSHPFESKERYSLNWFRKPRDPRELAQVRHGAEYVESLVLSGPGFDDGALETLAHMPLRRLSHVGLDQTLIRGPGLRQLGLDVPLRSLSWHSLHALPLDLEPLGTFCALEELTLQHPTSTPHGLSTLAALRSLESLTLQVRAFGGEQSRVLSGLTGLRTLNLDDTAMDDAGLVFLRPLHELRSLSLEGTRVGDEGLSHLLQLNLRAVFLRGSRVTREGVAWLQRQRPQLRLHSGPRPST